MLGKLVLGVSALLFTGYGLVSFFSPGLPAGFAGLEMTNGDAFAEIGAMYGGLQTGFGLFCLLAIIKKEFYRPGLMMLVLGVGMLACARAYSMLMTAEAVSNYTTFALGYEFATTIVAGIAYRLSDPPEAN